MRSLILVNVFILILCSLIKDIMHEDSGSDLLVIRHVESIANQITTSFAAKYSIDRQQIKQHPEYEKEVRFSLDYVDPLITLEGIEQCKNIKEKLEQFKPDLILVSPLNRALMTCQQISKEISCPIIVQPLLSERNFGSSDSSLDLQSKTGMFLDYDFSKVSSLGQYWTFSNDSLQNQAQYSKIIEENKEKGFRETMKAICEYRLQTKLTESYVNLHQRIQPLKSLLRNYKATHKRIALISHANVISSLLAKQFTPDSEPIGVSLKNGQVFETTVEQLCSTKSSV